MWTKGEIWTKKGKGKEEIERNIYPQKKTAHH